MSFEVNQTMPGRLWRALGYGLRDRQVGIVRIRVSPEKDLQHNNLSSSFQNGENNCLQCILEEVNPAGEWAHPGRPRKRSITVLLPPASHPLYW
jgi:hypothetical protein